MKFLPFDCKRILVLEPWTVPYLSRLLVRRILNHFSIFSVTDTQDSSCDEWDSKKKPEEFHDIIISFNDSKNVYIISKGVKKVEVPSSLDARTAAYNICQAVYSLCSLEFPAKEVKHFIASKEIIESLSLLGKWAFLDHQNGNPDVSLLEKAHALDPSNPEILWRLAVDSHMAKRDAKGALSFLESANKESPFYLRAFLSAALILRDLDLKDDAEKAYVYACEHMQYNPWPFQNYGIHLFNDLKKPKEAIEQFKKAISISAYFKAEVYYNLGICYRSLKDLVNAADSFEKYVLAKNPKWVASLDKNELLPFYNNTSESFARFSDSLVMTAEAFRDVANHTKTALFYVRYLKATWPDYFDNVAIANYSYFEGLDQGKVSEFGGQLTKLLGILKNAAQEKRESFEEGMFRGSLMLSSIEYLSLLFPGDESVATEQQECASSFTKYITSQWGSILSLLDKNPKNLKEELERMGCTDLILSSFRNDLQSGTAFLTSFGKLKEAEKYRSYFSVILSLENKK